MPNKNRYQLAKILANKAKNKNSNTEEPSVVSPGENVEESPPPHLESFPNSSKEEIFSDYLNFLRSLPPLIESEKTKIINSVKGSL